MSILNSWLVGRNRLAIAFQNTHTSPYVNIIKQQITTTKLNQIIIKHDHHQAFHFGDQCRRDDLDVLEFNQLNHIFQSINQSQPHYFWTSFPDSLTLNQKGSKIQNPEKGHVDSPFSFAPASQTNILLTRSTLGTTSPESTQTPCRKPMSHIASIRAFLRRHDGHEPPTSNPTIAAQGH